MGSMSERSSLLAVSTAGQLRRWLKITSSATMSACDVCEQQYTQLVTICSVVGTTTCVRAHRPAVVQHLKGTALPRGAVDGSPQQSAAASTQVHPVVAVVLNLGNFGQHAADG